MRLKKEILLELVLCLGTVSVVLVLLLFLAIIICLPLNNYHYANGVVEYKYQYRISSQHEGSIEKFFVNNGEYIRKGKPILQYYSDEQTMQAALVDLKIKYLNQELNILQKLTKAGALAPFEMDKKKVELLELEYKKKYLGLNTLNAPTNGTIHFMNSPAYLKGSYIKKSELVGFIYNGNEKHIRITFDNKYIDRFNIGSTVLVKYKDPMNLKIKKMKGNIYKTNVNELNSSFEIFCEIREGRHILELLPINTTVNASILINSTSILRDLIGDDLPDIDLGKNSIYQSIIDLL